MSSAGKNFLLLGIDEVSGSSDVIMLSHVDFDQKEIKLLQIPRDSYTAEHGKINSLFAAAYHKALKEGNSQKKSLAQGAKAISTHLSDMLGVTVDNYAVLTLKD
ncbi:MAG: LCP family protein, partial [Lentisphaeria bacterium]|nr:LCP family protein [Lentisphaeria bacterium]